MQIIELHFQRDLILMENDLTMSQYIEVFCKRIIPVKMKNFH